METPSFSDRRAALPISPVDSNFRNIPRSCLLDLALENSSGFSREFESLSRNCGICLNTHVFAFEVEVFFLFLLSFSLARRVRPEEVGEETFNQFQSLVLARESWGTLLHRKSDLLLKSRIGSYLDKFPEMESEGPDVAGGLILKWIGNLLPRVVSAFQFIEPEKLSELGFGLLPLQQRWTDRFLSVLHRILEASETELEGCSSVEFDARISGFKRDFDRENLTRREGVSASVEHGSTLVEHGSVLAPIRKGIC